MARYGTHKIRAQQLGRQDAVKPFDETLREEIETDQTLTRLAEQSGNKKAT